MASCKRNTSAKKRQERLVEIIEKLEQGVKDVFQSENYKNYLKTMAKFYHYSLNNTILIDMQRPGATLVAGHQAWQQKFGRRVKPGEKGIRILAPMPKKVKEKQEVFDPETGELLENAQGDPVTETVEKVKLYGFRVVTVFDISQTEGKELPSLGVQELSGNVEQYETFLKAIQAVSPVPVTMEAIRGTEKGYFSLLEQRIVLKEGMSQTQTIKTAIHELAHAKLHGEIPKTDDTDAVASQKSRETKEVEAESVAYTICQHYGIETSDYSFGYIAGWSSGRELKELKASLETIRTASAQLIRDLDKQFHIFCETQNAAIQEKKSHNQKEVQEPSATFVLFMT